MKAGVSLSTLAGVLGCLACFGQAPTTHYYRLVPPALQSAPPPPNAALRSLPSFERTSDAVLAVKEFEVAAAYDDTRIVYRTSPFHLRYYYYHRWSAPPSIAVRDYFRAALERSGAFSRVTSRTSDPSAVLRVGGVIFAMEEVDLSEERWIANLSLEVHAESTLTGRTLWSRTFEESQTLEKRHPESLARSTSTALHRILVRIVPQLQALAARELRAAAELRERDPASVY